MEAIKNFDEFYDIKVAPYLDDFKNQDQKAGYWEIAAVVSVLLIVPVMAYGLGKDSGIFGGLLIIATVAMAVVSTYNFVNVKEDYASDYKEHIVQEIIRFIHPGLEYKPDICINHTDYKNSSLCRGWYDDYDGEDWIGGNYNGLHFKCCELNVSRRTGPRNSSNIIYHGLFFVAPMNVGFRGGTYIWIKGNEQLAASIAEERYRLLPMPEVVRVDLRNGDFEKHYVVYTTDVYEASTIVSQELMAAIMNFKRQIERDITLSFVAGVCYVSIPFRENLFEPHRGDPGDKETIKNYFFTVLLILGIIKQLQLDKM